MDSPPLSHPIAVLTLYFALHLFLRLQYLTTLVETGTSYQHSSLKTLFFWCAPITCRTSDRRHRLQG